MTNYKLRSVLLLGKTGLLSINRLMSWLRLLGVTVITFDCTTGTDRFTKVKCFGKFTNTTSVKGTYIDTNIFHITNRFTLTQTCYRSINVRKNLFLVISLYDVLLLVEEKLIRLWCGVKVKVISLASLTFPCSMRCNKPL